MDPELEVARHFLGLLYYDLGLYQKAIRAFDLAISLDPGNAGVYKDRAEAHIRLDMY